MEINMYKALGIYKIRSGELGEKIMGRESFGEKVLCHGSVTHVSRERHGAKLESSPGSESSSPGFLGRKCQLRVFQNPSKLFFLIFRASKPYPGKTGSPTYR